jgi:hypothetical protein
MDGEEGSPPSTYTINVEPLGGSVASHRQCAATVLPASGISTEKTPKGIPGS